MPPQSTEAESDGMTEWLEAEYAGDGFQATRVAENRIRLRLPKQADNIGELITRAHNEHGAICDLSLDSTGRAELTLWRVPCDEEDALLPPKHLLSTRAKWIGIIAATICCLVVLVEFLIPPLELGL